MFDIATRPSPASSDFPSLAVPFDWRLTPALAPSGYPWTDYGTASAQPQGHVDVLATYALGLEDTLQTAIILSLFTDTRASDDDALPLGVTNRRGWVGDEFMADSFDAEPDNWGSLLWLIYGGTADVDKPKRANFYVIRALSWMVRDRIASKVDCSAMWVGAADSERLAIRPQIFKAGDVKPVYDVLWATSIRRGASA